LEPPRSVLLGGSPSQMLTSVKEPLLLAQSNINFTISKKLVKLY